VRSAAALALFGSLAASAAPAAAPVPVIDLNSEIHAVSARFVAQAIREAGTSGAPLVILRIDTPGGRLDSTREITQAILASPVPVVGWVAPSGSQAASAGFIILMSCDIAAMAPGTNAGAASPVGAAEDDLEKGGGGRLGAPALRHRAPRPPRG
jgi:membrane-bound serine protease (ClpP class)